MPHRYYPEKIESKWQDIWDARQCFKTGTDTSKPKYYVLDMFPYPSGAGLHIGHPEGYTATDIVARYKRMNGFNVLHPMGWDAFGLPAERAAVREGRHPADITRANIDNFRRQMKRLGFSYDWTREVSTTDPSYYKWTQWIFLKLHEMGLAYMAEVPVNWCPAQGTVLANEEVQDGRYIETGDVVERRQMRQWMLRITAYADRLVDDLEGLDWPPSVMEMQRQWIGRSEGARVRFALRDHKLHFDVFTTRPDTLFGATFCVLAPEHPLVAQITTPDQKEAVEDYVAWTRNVSDRDREINTAKEKTGVFTGAYALNPASAEPVPIWIADYVKMDYGSGAIMAVPGHDERDYEFARNYGIRIREVVSGGEIADEAYIGDGRLVNSDFLDGMDTATAKRCMIDWLAKRGLGEGQITYKLRDWLFSRQRYWGEPFPLLHHPDGRILPLPADSLPLTLPMIDEYRPTDDGRPPLARAQDWVEVSLDNQTLQRETNTMPQWAGSCWYYLRFMDPHNAAQAFSPEAEKYWGPVDLYIGGVEHAVLHLLYARFWHKVLFDCGLVSTKEPFQKLFNQGFILGTSHRDANGKYYLPQDVETRDAQNFVKGTDTPVVSKIEKMSKSKYNVVNPDDVVAEYGADALRLYEMFMGPLEASKPWQTNGIEGVYGFLERAWAMILDTETGQMRATVQDLPADSADPALLREIHATVDKVTRDIEALRFNTAIARMMECVNLARRQAVLPKSLAEMFVLVLAPFAPHMCEEIWQRLGHSESLTHAPWPQAEERWLVSDTVTVIVNVNGKRRAELHVTKGLDESHIAALAKAQAPVQRQLEGKEIKKTIFLVDRLINFIVST
ncbi:MAG: leucine--tRNA ligase [Alphaproteobacteria bacterium]|nr:MAG: leucine--tRNA ligase [Alphaproteobacteria bacterium]